MRYRIDFDKTINQLVPHYMGGRKLILYLQSIIHPLQTLNDWFVEYAKEKRIDAAMTSQKFKFEWYLKRRLKKFFVDENTSIAIENTRLSGTPIYWAPKNIEVERPESISDIVIHNEEEAGPATAFYWQYETPGGNDCSFVVHVPEIIEEKLDICKAQLYGYIEKYRLANKTYKVEFQSSKEDFVE